MGCQNAIGENEVARLQSARQCSDYAGPDYQLRAGYRIERAARNLRRASMADPMADDCKRFARDLRTEAMQAVVRDWRAIALSFLERRDLPGERIEKKNQSRALSLELPSGA